MCSLKLYSEDCWTMPLLVSLNGTPKYNRDRDHRLLVTDEPVEFEK